MAVGTSGSSGLRRGSSVTSALALPSLTKVGMSVPVENIMLVRPPARSVSAGASPL